MSTVSATNGSSQTQNALSTMTNAGGIAPTEDTFLKLLVSQLKNQDPLNPADSTQFVGQLAQFSSLEQLIHINTSTTALASALTPTQTTPTPAKKTESGS